MKALCDAITESLAGIDTDNPGCHNFCYAKFTKNLDRLKTQHTPNKSPPRKRHSPRKMCTPSKTPLSPESRIFPENVYSVTKKKSVRMVSMNIAENLQFSEIDLLHGWP